MSIGAVQVDSKLTAPFQVVGLVECLGLGLVLQWHNSDFGAGGRSSDVRQPFWGTGPETETKMLCN